MTVPAIIHIQAAVCHRFRIELAELLSVRRERRVAHPRQAAMFLAVELTTRSLPTIGRAFGRDHTTVLYACRMMKERLQSDPELAADVAALRRELTSPAQEAA